jgi:hypothetical protein
MSIAETPDPYGAYPRLNPEQIEALKARGTRRETTAGEVIFHAGDRSYDFVVVLQGLVAIVEHDQGAMAISSSGSTSGAATSSSAPALRTPTTARRLRAR